MSWSKHERLSTGRLLPWACAVGAAGAQVVVLLLGPKGIGGVVSALVTGLVFAGLAAVGAWAVYRRRRVLPAVPAPRSEATPGAEHDPSPEMFLATRLARRGVDARRIAEHCAIPLALADLMVEQARQDGAPESA